MYFPLWSANSQKCKKALDTRWPAVTPPSTKKKQLRACPQNQNTPFTKPASQNVTKRDSQNEHIDISQEMVVYFVNGPTASQYIKAYNRRANGTPRKIAMIYEFIPRQHLKKTTHKQETTRYRRQATLLVLPGSPVWTHKIIKNCENERWNFIFLNGKKWKFRRSLFCQKFDV